MEQKLLLSLSFGGGETKRHQIDLYDVAYALIGFQRSLALTTHLVLNDEIITQAPSLKGASIYATPPQEGSWTIMAVITFIAGASYKLGTAPKDTPIGHIVHSAYDYVVKKSLGFHVDYDQSLGQQYAKLKEAGYQGPVLSRHRFDSVIEKCEPALREMHRPIVGEKTATKAEISALVGNRTRSVGGTFNKDTYEYMRATVLDKRVSRLEGRVASYNSNTFKGRMFIASEGRPIPFELDAHSRDQPSLQSITNSLAANTLYPDNMHIGYIGFHARKRMSKTGLLKSLEITSVSS